MFSTPVMGSAAFSSESEPLHRHLGGKRFWLDRQHSDYKDMLIILLFETTQWWAKLSVRDRDYPQVLSKPAKMHIVSMSQFNRSPSPVIRGVPQLEGIALTFGEINQKCGVSQKGAPLR
jgi:hypothetical protein